MHQNLFRNLLKVFSLKSKHYKLDWILSLALAWHRNLDYNSKFTKSTVGIPSSFKSTNFSPSGGESHPELPVPRHPLLLGQPCPHLWSVQGRGQCWVRRLWRLHHCHCYYQGRGSCRRLSYRWNSCWTPLRHFRSLHQDHPQHDQRCFPWSYHS